MGTNLVKAVLITMFLFVSSICYASPTTTVATPNSFSSNTVIQSSKVNDNFSHVQTQYNTHSHTDVTQLGTITSGTWQATALSTQYGGTGQDFSTASSGSIIIFNATGTMTTIPNGNDGQVLSISGTSPKWATTVVKDAILTGYEVVIEQPNAARCIVNGGVLYNNITQVDKTTGTVLTLATVSDWSSGSTLSITSDWNYLGVSATGQVALLGTDIGLYPNTSIGVEATGPVVGLYAYETDGSATKQYWRIIGAIFQPSSSTITQSFQNDRTIMWNVPNNFTTVISSGVWSNGVYTNIPKISKLGIFGITITGGAAAGPCGAWLRPNNSTWSTNNSNGIFMQITASNHNIIGGQRICATDDNQQIQWQNYSGDESTRIDVEGYYLNIR